MPRMLPPSPYPQSDTLLDVLALIKFRTNPPAFLLIDAPRTSSKRKTN
jgi:hypothetical protein